MLDIETVKAYVKIEEDDPALDLIYPAAVEYVQATVGDAEGARVDLFFAAVVQHMYDCRNLHASDSLKMKQELDRVFTSILLQIQTETWMKEGKEHETT